MTEMVITGRFVQWLLVSMYRPQRIPNWPPPNFLLEICLLTASTNPSYIGVIIEVYNVRWCSLIHHYVVEKVGFCWGTVGGIRKKKRLCLWLILRPVSLLKPLSLLYLLGTAYKLPVNNGPVCWREEWAIYLNQALTILIGAYFCYGKRARRYNF